jgi:hypothetical protein
MGVDLMEKSRPLGPEASVDRSVVGYRYPFPLRTKTSLRSVSRSAET